MQKPFYVSFAGHRQIDRFCEVESKLYEIVYRLLISNEFTEFFVGCNGEFDIMASSVIRRARKALGKNNSAMTLVLPYQKSDMEFMKNSFDSILIPGELGNIHPKAAITARNRWMVLNEPTSFSVVLNEKRAVHGRRCDML